MTGLFSKLFGGKKSEEREFEGTSALVLETLEKVIDLSGLELDIEVTGSSENSIQIDLSGRDEELLTTKEGQLLDAIQLLLTRTVQHQCPDERFVVSVDNSGYRQQANDQLIQLANKLKGVALEKGKPVYFRALAPRDRKVVHQHLAEDHQVKSRSVGEGLFKKIKIVPLREESPRESTTEL